MIRRCNIEDFDQIWDIVNDGAQAYTGVIPVDRLRDPYMNREELQYELDAGVIFWGYLESAMLVGVMGVQPVQDVTLIRHAYVRTRNQKQGIGKNLLNHLRGITHTPLLIGTWADALWAIHFYENHGFRRVGLEDKARLLRRYWTVPERQIETSIVLGDHRWWTYTANPSATA